MPTGEAFIQNDDGSWQLVGAYTSTPLPPSDLVRARLNDELSPAELVARAGGTDAERVRDWIAEHMPEVALTDWQQRILESLYDREVGAFRQRWVTGLVVPSERLAEDMVDAFVRGMTVVQSPATEPDGGASLENVLTAIDQLAAGMPCGLDGCDRVLTGDTADAMFCSEGHRTAWHSQRVQRLAPGEGVSPYDSLRGDAHADDEPLSWMQPDASVLERARAAHPDESQEPPVRPAAASEHQRLELEAWLQRLAGRAGRGNGGSRQPSAGLLPPPQRYTSQQDSPAALFERLAIGFIQDVAAPYGPCAVEIRYEIQRDAYVISLGFEGGRVLQILLNGNVVTTGAPSAMELAGYVRRKIQQSLRAPARDPRGYRQAWQ